MAHSSGKSLNSHLLIDQHLLPQLTDVLLNWRTYRYVLATNIEKMYRQILVHPVDRHLQRIVWRFSTADNIRKYRLNTYGLVYAPFLAIRTLRQLAIDETNLLGAALSRRLRRRYFDRYKHGDN